MRRTHGFPRPLRSIAPALALLSLLATTVVAGALPAGRGAASGPPGLAAPTAGSPFFTHQSTVRLITGDRVRVLTRADGSSVSTILPGSPHAGLALVRWRTGTDSYVLPRTSASERRRLDLSLFDVDALAATRGGRVPVMVRFARHGGAHPVRGLGLDLTAARSNGSVASGSYGPGFRGLTDRDLAGVASIRLSVPRVAPTRTAPTHHVVVQVVDAGGHLAPGVIVTVENVDDATTFQDSTGAGGRAAFDVPDGHYSAVAFTFSRLVIAAEVDVTADQTVDLDLGDATVKPHVSMPGYHVLDTALSVARTPATGFTFSFGFTGPRFSVKVQPTDSVVAHGGLGTGVSATLAPLGVGRAAPQDRLAVTADVSAGVPGDLTYTHHPRDFAKVVDRFYANGPGGLRETFLGAFGSLPHGFLDLFSGQEYLAHVPGRRTVLFEAGRHTSYQQTLMPQAASIDSQDLTQLGWVGSFGHAGTSHLLTFGHGPVGPGFRGSVDPSADYVTRHRRRLVGFLPLFEGAGSSMFSFVDRRDGAWSLRSGERAVAHGHHEIALHATVPPGLRTYVLTATSHPVSPIWTLSTRVQDTWTFRSGADRPSVPLLMPRYVPPVAMGGTLAAGHTSFSLGFHSLTRHDHRIIGAHLQLSTDDGRSWHDAGLTRTSPTTFRVGYQNPGAHGSARFMSMRVVARDAVGDSVTETAMRVYRLR